MKPAPLQAHRPDTQAAAVSLLGEYGDDAKVIAGGQSLVPLMNLRLARPAHLVDVSSLSELRQVTIATDEVVIGSATRHSDILADPALAQACPLLAEATRYVAHPAIRNRGTVGGSLVHADPAAEQPAACLALGGRVVLQSTTQAREIALDEFFLGPYTTALDPSELLVEIRLPRRADLRSAFAEHSRRPGDFALVAIAATARLDQGRVTGLRLVAAGVANRPVRLTEAESALLGAEASPETISAATQHAFDRIDVRADVHGGSAYRAAVGRHLVEQCLWRVLT